MLMLLDVFKALFGLVKVEAELKKVGCIIQLGLLVLTHNL